MPAPPPPPAPTQLPLLVDQVDHWDCEDYGIDPDRPDSPLSGDGIDLALAGLMKGLLGIDSAELETLLKDLSMPGPGTKDRISVKEVVEVSFISYITLYITWYITLYGWQLGVFPEMDREAPGLFTAS